MINLKDFGIKQTKSRQHILDILDNSKEPMTAEDIFRELINEEINLSTVYRTLNAFYEQSIVYKEIDKDGKALFMILREKHKHVLICTKCGKKIFLKECPYKNIDNEILKETGFKIENHNIEIYGLCQDCQKKGVLEI
ncbi:MAG: transcriptional repressor [Acholeplasmatales bacterium]|nr:transcriptional repressor [Acholeplasmatales bacterium]